MLSTRSIVHVFPEIGELHLAWPDTVTCATRTTALSCSARKDLEQKRSATRRPHIRPSSSTKGRLAAPTRHSGLALRLPKRSGWQRPQHESDKRRVHPSQTLHRNIHPPEASTGWKVRHDKCCALLGAAFGPLHKLQGKLDRAERLEALLRDAWPLQRSRRLLCLSLLVASLRFSD